VIFFFRQARPTIEDHAALDLGLAYSTRRQEDRTASRDKNAGFEVAKTKRRWSSSPTTGRGGGGGGGNPTPVYAAASAPKVKQSLPPARDNLADLWTAGDEAKKTGRSAAAATRYSSSCSRPTGSRSSRSGADQGGSCSQRQRLFREKPQGHTDWVYRLAIASVADRGDRELGTAGSGSVARDGQPLRTIAPLPDSRRGRSRPAASK